MFGKKPEYFITTTYCPVGKFVDFLIVEDDSINSENLKQRVKEELKKINADVLYEFQRTPKGFCGNAGKRR